MLSARRTGSLIWLLVLLLISSLPVQADVARAGVVSTSLPGGLKVSAEYRVGEPKLPAVLLVHGFLQTRNYLTVAGLVNGLADAGYTVLAPTLSLGVQARKRSLACEAIHTHSMQDDVAEIDFWVKWLVKQGHNQVILVGHSFGSLQSLVYLDKKPHPAVKQLIATSLITLENSMGHQAELQQQVRKAREAASRGDNNLDDYALSFCNKYPSPAKAYLSYAEWSKERILNLLVRTRVPVEVIVGGSDKRMGTDWKSLMIDKGARVTTIPGANHFFDAAHEFDLLETVEKSIRKSNAG